MYSHFLQVKNTHSKFIISNLNIMKTKKYFFAALAVILLSSTSVSFAQQDVQLKITHQLDGADFSMSQEASNNMGNAFKTERLEYYISNINILHDGDQVTNVEDTFILVNTADGSNQTFDLGSHDVSDISGIRFSIGIGPDENHLDPSQYDASHPLAPKSPSMHWGWASGYRFVAMEGKAGDNFISTFEFHALGDDNYFETEILASSTTISDTEEIAIIADYTKAIKDIDVSTGAVIHGDYGDAVVLLENFRDNVFSPAMTVGVDENEPATQIILYPSHSTDGHFNITSPVTNISNVQVYNYTGQLVLEQTQQNNIYIANKGMYLVLLFDEAGQKIATKKLSIL